MVTVAPADSGGAGVSARAKERDDRAGIVRHSQGQAAGVIADPAASAGCLIMPSFWIEAVPVTLMALLLPLTCKLPLS